MWAKDSDEEDNEDNVRQRTRKPKDFSAPIGFVAGGVQQAGKKKEEKKGILEIFYTHFYFFRKKYTSRLNCS